MYKIILFVLLMVIIMTPLYSDTTIVILNALFYDNGNMSRKEFKGPPYKARDIGFSLLYKITNDKIIKYYAYNEITGVTCFLIRTNEKLDKKQYIFAEASNGETIKIIFFSNDHAVIIEHHNGNVITGEGFYKIDEIDVGLITNNKPLKSSTRLQE